MTATLPPSAARSTARPEPAKRRRAETDWHASGRLASAAARGGLVTALGTWARCAVQLVTVIGVTRALGPSQYGFAAVVIVYNAGTELLRGSGLASAVIQRKRVPHGSASTVHYLNCALGVLLTAVLMAAAPAISTVFGMGHATRDVALLALVFLLAGPAAVPAALLARNLAFGRLAAVEFTAVVASCGTALALAAGGAGSSALVAQALVASALSCVGTLLVCPWRPGRPAPWRTVRGYAAFGANVAGVQALNLLTRSVDKALVGGFFGPVSAALYTQAGQLLILPLEQVATPMQRVAVPALSRVYGNRDAFRHCYRTLVSLVGYILWPMFITLAVLADAIVETLFGSEWAAAAELFRILVIAGVAQVLGHVTAWVFVASGQVRRQTLWAVATRPLVIGSFFIGIPWGVRGMALSYALASLAMVLPGFLVVRRRAGLAVTDLLRAVLRPALLSTAVGIVLLATVALVDPRQGWPALLGCAATAVLTAVGLTLAIPSVRAELAGFIGLLRRAPVPAEKVPS
ncbi:lipopolysaccharide biosynthesis protein [Streptomyces pathocidini]|uniref:Lipopolysaccharide biosynthesis protein n=1 Tax=Streptomyces pathocidini TaxID=1650571 RepID=A0ABW7URT1_9ACTN|nr:lipopolysaccharide biosynthesis protein [Streptomyces pathocidini]